MSALAKAQHLPGKTAVRICGGIFGRILKNALACRRALRHLDGVFDRPLKHMVRVAVDVHYALPDTATQLRSGLVHRQQYTCNLQARIKLLFDRTHHIQHIRDAFTGEKVGLDRDDAVVRRRKSVDGQQFVFQAAVDDDIVVGIPQEWHEAVHDLFTGPLSVTHGVILGELHHLKPGRRVGQPTVGGDQGESASRVKDPAFKVNFQVLRVVNGGQQKICQCSFLFSGSISQCGREIALGVVVN